MTEVVCIPPPGWDVAWLAGRLMPAGLFFWGGDESSQWATKDPRRAIRYCRMEDAELALKASYRTDRTDALYEYAFDPTNLAKPLLVQKLVRVC